MVATSPEELRACLRRTLLAHRNGDGGWGYYAGKRSRVEPTCYAVLSFLQRGDPGDDMVVDEGLALLARWQGPGGLIAEPGLPPNIGFNGLASVCLSMAGARTRGAARTPGIGRALLDALLRVESVTISNWFSPIRQDNSLVGWPWTEDAFGWVEPTSWCILALRAASRETDRRVMQAESLLFDRQCPDGGWNYGNPEAFGQALHSHVPPTALALLALRRHANRSEIKRGLDWLLDRWRSEPTGLALSLTSLCFAAHGVPRADLVALLHASYVRAEFLGNLAVSGLASFALAPDTDATSLIAG